MPSLTLPSLLSLVLLHAVAAKSGPAVWVATQSSALTAPPADAPPKQPVPAPVPPAAAAVPCKLLTPEAPRGGRLEVEGDGFGKTPVVRIDGRVARTLERTTQRIAVQIAADSKGGKVTVAAGGKDLQCGMLTIIGIN
jgi:hypothetical protein